MPRVNTLADKAISVYHITSRDNIRPNFIIVRLIADTIS